MAVHYTIPRYQTNLVVTIEHRGPLSIEEQNVLQANIEALLREVRPDLVEQNIETPIIDISVCDLHDIMD